MVKVEVDVGGKVQRWTFWVAAWAATSCPFVSLSLASASWVMVGERTGKISRWQKVRGAEGRRGHAQGGHAITMRQPWP